MNQIPRPIASYFDAPLVTCVNNGWMDKITQILNSGIYTKLDLYNAMIAAGRDGLIELIEQFIRAGADVKSIPLIHVVVYSMFNKDHVKQTSIVKLLWENGAVHEILFVMECAMLNNQKQVIMVIFNAVGHLLNVDSIFQWACIKGHLDIVQIIVENYIVLNQQIILGGFYLAIILHQPHVSSYLYTTKLSSINSDEQITMLFSPYILKYEYIQIRNSVIPVAVDPFTTNVNPLTAVDTNVVQQNSVST